MCVLIKRFIHFEAIVTHTGHWTLRVVFHNGSKRQKANFVAKKNRQNFQWKKHRSVEFVGQKSGFNDFHFQVYYKFAVWVMMIIANRVFAKYSRHSKPRLVVTSHISVLLFQAPLWLGARNRPLSVKRQGSHMSCRDNRRSQQKACLKNGRWMNGCFWFP